MNLFVHKLGEGPALIILHGLYGSGDNWFNIAKSLSKNFTVYLVDQRNHGNSFHSPFHTYKEMANDLDRVISAEKLENISIIGHSMGGKTAMTYTLEHGSKVNKLVIVDISPYSYIESETFKEQFKFHEEIIERFITAPVQTTASRSEIDKYFSEKIKNKNVRRFLLKNLKRNKNNKFSWKLNIDTIAKSFEDILDAAPPVKLGAESYVDTLFLRGGESPYISDEDTESIKDVFRNSKFITYRECGHWLHAEEPDRFIEDIKAFLL